MTKEIISVLLVLILCFCMAVSVSAAEFDAEFVIDEFGNLTEEELASLNQLAQDIYQKTGVGIFFTYLYTDSVEDYDVSAIVNGITDYVVMMENETHWYMHLGGIGENIDYDTEEELRAIYNETETYIEGVEAFLLAAADYFPEITDTEEEIAVDGEECFLYDEADLLTDAEEQTLAAKLEEISHTYQSQIVIVTLASMDGGDIDEFNDYLYDTMGFGYGENHEGVLLLVCMDPREYRILANGLTGVAIGPDQIDVLCSLMDTYLPDGRYATAFSYFANQCDEYLEYYQNGSPFKFGKNLVISLLIGIAAGLIVAFVLKAQLKSVYKQEHANVYVKKDSMQVDTKYDIFLYRTVTTRRKEKDHNTSSSGSGSSTRSEGGGSF